MRGFTLLEVMVVLAILAILAGMAAPNAAEWVAGQRIRDTASDLHTSFVRARSEAITRGLATSVRPVSANWANGWTIPNPDITYNPDVNAPTVFIEQHGPVENASISGGSAVTFTSVGRLSGSAVAIKVSSSQTDQARCVTIDTAGRPKTRAITAAATCS